MKIFYSIGFATIISSLMFLLGGCGKSFLEKDYEGFDGQVVMAQAAEGRNIIPLSMSSTPSLVAFGASYGKAMTAAPKDISVEFELREDLITEFNQENNTDYIPLPPNSYSISGLTSVIKKGKTTSEPLDIIIESKKLDVNERYMFPISLKSATGEKIDSAFSVTLFRINKIVRPERDITSQGTLSVNIDNAGGADDKEGSKKVVDNNIDTKFYTGDFAPGLWMQLAFQNEVAVGAYTLTSANDANNQRDPKAWVFQGSDNALNWVDLDVQANFLFSGPKETRRFELDNEHAYKFYRIVINEKTSSANKSFQLSEWRLVEYFEQ